MKSSRDDRLAHQQAILRFLDTYGQASTEERLWMMFWLTLSIKEGNDLNEIQRANWFHFYELLNRLGIYLDYKNNIHNKLPSSSTPRTI